MKAGIMAESWDHLIVLDACRYDYFERHYREFLNGKLDKRHSVGTSTLEWRDRSFPDRYDDVVYVSSNPYIASTSRVKGFVGGDHFAAVYDVWKTGWDQQLGTVPPEAVNRAAIGALMKHGNMRLIVHYLQPHAPYLSLSMGNAGFPSPDPDADSILRGTKSQDNAFKLWLLKLLTPLATKSGFGGANPTWKLRQLLRMAPASPMDAVRRYFGIEVLREAYAENLKIVLKKVSTLMRYLSGRIVVTSDHGELLGEGGCFSHFSGSTNPLLLEIPWLVIDKPQSEESPRLAKGEDEEGEVSDDAQIKARLRALGYID